MVVVGVYLVLYLLYGVGISAQFLLPDSPVAKARLPISSFLEGHGQEDIPNDSRGAGRSNFFVRLTESEKCGPNNRYFYMDIVNNTNYVIIKVCYNKTMAQAFYTTHKIQINKNKADNEDFWDEDCSDEHEDCLDEDEVSRATGPYSCWRDNESGLTKQIFSSAYNNQMDVTGELPNKYKLQVGHLTPACDIEKTLGASYKRATNFWINSSPHWNVINNRAWKVVENDVRRKYYKGATVYTGNMDVLNYSDIYGLGEQIIQGYLYLYENRKIPIPRFLWKVVINTARGEPLNNTLYIVHNNPYLYENIGVISNPCSCNSDCKRIIGMPSVDNIKWGMFCCEFSGNDITSTCPEIAKLINKIL